MTTINPTPAPNHVAISLAEMKGKMDGGQASNLQLIYAAIQLAMASSNKTAAFDKLDEVEKQQEKLKEAMKYANMCDEIIRLKHEWDDMDKDSKAAFKKENPLAYCVTGRYLKMPEEMMAFLEENNIQWHDKGNDLDFKSNEWKVHEDALKGLKEQLHAKVKELMISVEDFMGQYNANLEGANRTREKGQKALDAALSAGKSQ
jgi:hypothetical protein